MFSKSLIVLTIVTSLLCSCAEKPPKADLVIFNANIYTMNTVVPKAEALAVVGGEIVYLGNNVNANLWVADTTTILDLGGKMLMPGFIEGHGHLMGIGYNQLNVNLANTTSYDDIVKKVAERVATTPEGEWIQGRGWHQDKWFVLPEDMPGGFPTHHQLSEISPNHPVVLFHASGHGLLANAKALELANIDQDTESEEGGEVFRDVSGQPTGVLNENAMTLMTKVMPPNTDEQNIEALNLAIQTCLENGITSFHDAGIGQDIIDLYNSFITHDLLKIRVYAMLASWDEDLLIRWFEAGPQIGSKHDNLTVRSIKLMADGALGSRGALLLEDYSDAPGQKGLKVQSSDFIMRMTAESFKSGFQVAIHCIGDQANHEALDFFEIVLNSDTTVANPRFRIEHAQHLAADDIARFGKLGVIPSMQAIHLSSDRAWAIDRLGKQRIEEGAYVWKSLLDSGAVLMNGTDAPVEPVNPLASFYASVTRQDLTGSPEEGYEPAQALSREEALRCYTINNAYGAFEEDIKGSIEVGKLADFTVLSKDIMTIPAKEILTTHVIYTIVDGEIVYQRSER